MAEEATTETTATTTDQAATTTTTTEQVEGSATATATTETTEVKDPAQTDKKDEPPAIPEKYEFVAPEGSTLDPAALEEFSTFAKDAGLKQETAQNLVNLSWKFQQEGIKNQSEAWRAETLADREIGGDKLEATTLAAKTFATKYGDKDFQALLNGPLGNYKPFLAALSKAGKDLGEGSIRTGGPSTPNEGNSFLPGSKRT